MCKFINIYIFLEVCVCVENEGGGGMISLYVPHFS